MSAVACKVREPANRSGMSCEVYEITIGALCSKVCRFTQCTRSVALGSLRVIGDTTMSMSKSFLAAIAAIAAVTVAQPSVAKDTVRIAFIGPLTGGNSAAGLGGRNSAQLAVSLRKVPGKFRSKGMTDISSAIAYISCREIQVGVSNRFHSQETPEIIQDSGRILKQLFAKNEFQLAFRIIVQYPLNLVYVLTS